MTKEELIEYYKTLPEDDKHHFDLMFDLDNIDRGIKSLNPSLQLSNIGYEQIEPRYVMHFKRETENISSDDNFVYIYKLLYVSTHSETKELLVNYEAMYEDESKGVKRYFICSRPIEMFISRVDTKKYPNIKQKYRFELVSNVKNDLTGTYSLCKVE